jgi:hypothetical protein
MGNFSVCSTASSCCHDSATFLTTGMTMRIQLYGVTAGLLGFILIVLLLRQFNLVRVDSPPLCGEADIL